MDKTKGTITLSREDVNNPLHPNLFDEFLESSGILANEAKRHGVPEDQLIINVVTLYVSEYSIDG